MPTFSDSGPAFHEGNAVSTLRTINRISLKDAAVQCICQAIEAKELKSGEIVTELGLAQKLGVSQPTIREALLELEFIGYVERTASRKTRVTFLTRRAIDNIYLVRTRLETLAAELVAAQSSPELQSCWEHLDEMEAAAKSGKFTEFCHADLEFHRAIWRCSRNECAENALERIVPKLFAFGIIQHARPCSAKLIDICELHRRLLNAILEGDLETTRKLMELSMEKAWLDDAQVAELV